MDNNRFELVKAALTGILANSEVKGYPEQIARLAIRYADAVLVELEKSQS